MQIVLYFYTNFKKKYISITMWYRIENNRYIKTPEEHCLVKCGQF